MPCRRSEIDDHSSGYTPDARAFALGACAYRPAKFFDTMRESGANFSRDFRYQPALADLKILDPVFDSAPPPVLKRDALDGSV